MKAKGIGICLYLRFKRAEMGNYGNARAIVTNTVESAAEKVEILREDGIGIIVRLSDFANVVEAVQVNSQVTCYGFGPG